MPDFPDGMDGLGRPLPSDPAASGRHDPNDPESVDRLKASARATRRADADVLRLIMKNVAGRDWLYRLLERCRIFGNPFAPGQPDVTAFRLGEQNVGKLLMQDAERASADLFAQMRKEQNAKLDKKDD